jgi:RimJ/RimL family protein N-acetyltransferase
MSDPDNVIRTERLVLTPPALADFEGTAALWGDPEVVRFLGAEPSTPMFAWLRLQRQAGSWVLFGHGPWTVRERAGGRFVGEVGFGNFHREMTPAFGDTPEAGWVLATWAQGKGYASEAVAAAHAWGEARFKGPRTVCMIDPENRPSLRVAAKAGYVEYARTLYGKDQVVLLERPLPGHRAASSAAGNA